MPSRLFAAAVVLCGFALPAFAAPTVELIDAGSGAKTSLVLAPKVGADESMEMVLDLVVGMDMGGESPKVTDAPPVKMVLKGKVVEKTPEGNYRYDFTLTDAGIEPYEIKVEMSDARRKEIDAINAQVREQAEKYRGTRGSLVVDAHGGLVSSRVDSPGEPFANLEKSLAHAMVPMPSEPVGVGAKWKAVDRVKESGLSLTQTITYTVKAIDAGHVELEMELAQAGDHDSFKMPNLPAGTKAELVGLASTGKGTAVVDLGRLLPRTTVLEQDFESRVVVVKENENMGMHIGMTMDMDLSIKRL
ncbi:MAG: hypothetical protein H6734_09950 [Alphaproteobacteria bacterium]|nr:hypothetical protein [Alphaproteobacteria bacterium]